MQGNRGAGCELHGTIRIDMVLKVKQQLGEIRYMNWSNNQDKYGTLREATIKVNMVHKVKQQL